MNAQRRQQLITKTAKLRTLLQNDVDGKSSSDRAIGHLVASMMVLDEIVGEMLIDGMREGE